MRHIHMRDVKRRKGLVRGVLALLMTVSMTGGIGTYSYNFVRYEQAPNDIQNAVIAAANEEN